MDLNLLLSFDLTVSAVHMHYDNQVALYIANNWIFHECTKHIEADCYFVRERNLSGVISPRYKPTTKQLADVITNALG